MLVLASLVLVDEQTVLSIERTTNMRMDGDSKHEHKVEAQKHSCSHEADETIHFVRFALEVGGENEDEDEKQEEYGHPDKTSHGSDGNRPFRSPEQDEWEEEDCDEEEVAEGRYDELKCRKLNCAFRA